MPHTLGTQSCALRTFADHGAALAFNRDFHPTVEARQICIRCDGALAPTFATRESWPENKKKDGGHPPFPQPRCNQSSGIVRVGFRGNRGPDTTSPAIVDRIVDGWTVSCHLKDCASTRPQQISEVYRAVLAARRGKPGTFQTTQLRLRNFRRLSGWPSRQLHRADRSPLPPHLKPTNRAPRSDIPRSRQSPAQGQAAIGRLSPIALGVGSAGRF